MNRIWLLSKSNIRKSKSSAITLLLIIFVAAILLNIGLLTIINYKKSFDQSAERVNSAHTATVMLKSNYLDEYEEYFTQYPGVTQVQKEDIIYLISSKFKFATGENTTPTMFLNADTKRELSYLSFVGEHKEEGDTDIYVSYLLHSGGGYDLGDEFIIHYRDISYSFRIAGFTEDLLLGSNNVGAMGFHLPKASYQKFLQVLNDSALTEGILLQTRLGNSSNAPELLTDFKKNMLKKDQGDANYYYTSIQDAKLGRTSTADIGGAIIICFSFIILLVSLLVITFRISTSIEEEMTDIGALKAIGYSSLQIKLSMILQFISIAAVGTMAGIAVSYLLLKQLASMFAAQTGLIWKQGFDFNISILSLMLIILSVLIIVPISTRRIKKLHPIIALRNGINTHSFKRNYCPLERMRGNLNLILALKSMMANLKQNIMIFLILVAVSFTSVFGIVLYYNIVVNDKAFIDMLGIEMCSIYATTVPDADSENLVQKIGEMEGVRKAINYEYQNVTVCSEDTQIYIMKDFSMLDNDLAYEGRYPEYDNEVAITGYIASKYDKKVGDIIAVQLGASTKDYIISGFFESSNNSGKGITMTIEGVRRMQPDYKFSGINIYLNKGMDVSDFDRKLIKSYSKEIAGTMNMDEMAKSQLGVYKSIVASFVYAIIFITILVVLLILYLVIKALIIRRRQEYGIQKAIGYTTYQLMTQTALCFLPVILVGAVFGGVIGGYTMNSIITMIFHGIGVMKVNFIIPSVWIMLMCIGIGMISYVIAMFVSFRIRKISAYSLIVDC